MTVIDAFASVAAEEEIAQLVRRYSEQLAAGRFSLRALLDRCTEISACGPWLRTRGGASLLDCGGYGMPIMGARHPIVQDTVLRQLTSRPGSDHVLGDPALAGATAALTSVTPAGLDRVRFTLTETEAVQAALNVALAHGKSRLITMGQPALSTAWQESRPRPSYEDIGALAQELARHPGEVCVFVEPSLEKDGRIAPPGLLAMVGELCRVHDAFLVLDELRTGLGRAGEWWRADVDGVAPDVLITGRALGGGVLPVSATVVRPEVVERCWAFEVLGTAPLALAAVRGAIAAIKEDRLVTRAIGLGDVLLPAIERVARHNCGELVRGVWGQGLLVGIELTEPGLALELLIALFRKGIVAGRSVAGHAILLAPPAVLTETDVHFLLDAFDRATRDLTAGR